MNFFTRNLKKSVLNAAVLATLAVNAGAFSASHVDAAKLVGGLNCDAVAGFTYAAGIMAGFSGGANLLADAAAAAGGLYLVFAC